MPPPAKRSSDIEPLAPARYKITFTASAKLRDKLQRLQALLRTSVPDGDLAAVIEQAVTEKLERIEAARFAKTKAPRKDLERANTRPTSRYIPAAVKRAVHARDRGRCTFKDRNGKRCRERNNLQYHHDDPYGRGGDHSVANVRLLCPAHNAYLAERDYGKGVMQRYRTGARERGRVSEPGSVYFTARRTLSGQSSRQPPATLLYGALAPASVWIMTNRPSGATS